MYRVRRWSKLANVVNIVLMEFIAHIVAEIVHLLIYTEVENDHLS